MVYNVLAKRTNRLELQMNKLITINEHYLVRKEHMMQFAKNLKELRTKKNITQGTLADKVGITRQMIIRYESGENYPEMDKAIEIAKALNCHLDDLVGDKDSEQNLNPFAARTISIKIEKPKLNKKNKVIEIVLWCLVSLFVFAAVAVGILQVTDKIGIVLVGCILPLLFAAWIATIASYRSR